MGASIGNDGRQAFDILAKELAKVSQHIYKYMYFMCLCLKGALSEGTQSKYNILEPVGPPKKPYPLLYPEEGLVYDYQFVKEVS